VVGEDPEQHAPWVAAMAAAVQRVLDA
jgi:hypothetical protein